MFVSSEEVRQTLNALENRLEARQKRIPSRLKLKPKLEICLDQREVSSNYFVEQLKDAFSEIQTGITGDTVDTGEEFIFNGSTIVDSSSDEVYAVTGDVIDSAEDGEVVEEKSSLMRLHDLPLVQRRTSSSHPIQISGESGLEALGGSIQASLDSQTLTTKEGHSCASSSSTSSKLGGSPVVTTNEEDPSAALWPRQPNQFQFSQENEGTITDSDEAYNEIELSDDGRSAFDEGVEETLFELDVSDTYLETDEQEDDGPTSYGTFNELEPYQFKDDTEITEEYDVIDLKIYTAKKKTGFEVKKHFNPVEGDILGTQYKVVGYIGEAVFSTTYKCQDFMNNELVCLKIIKNQKEYFDQGIDEIKILKYLQHAAAPKGVQEAQQELDYHHVLNLKNYFYFREHLIIVTELLKENLYEVLQAQKNRTLSLNSSISMENISAGESDDDKDGPSPAKKYLTMHRLREITHQCLVALKYIHSLDLIHSDLKPENIVMKEYFPCNVKVIDFGSSCFVTDPLASYVQSRAYRAPEVILGLSYNTKIDIWSLGCIVAELYSGRVLFQNESMASLLCSMITILGSIPVHMLDNGSEVDKYFSNDATLFHQASDGSLTFFYPDEELGLAAELDCFENDMEEALMVDFLTQALQIDPQKRPSAMDLLSHEWFNAEENGLYL